MARVAALAVLIVGAASFAVVEDSAARVAHFSAPSRSPGPTARVSTRSFSPARAPRVSRAMTVNSMRHANRMHNVNRMRNVGNPSRLANRFTSRVRNVARDRRFDRVDRNRLSLDRSNRYSDRRIRTRDNVSRYPGNQTTTNSRRLTNESTKNPRYPGNLATDRSRIPSVGAQVSKHRRPTDTYTPGQTATNNPRNPPGYRPPRIRIPGQPSLPPLAQPDDPQLASTQSRPVGPRRPIVPSGPLSNPTGPQGPTGPLPPTSGPTATPTGPTPPATTQVTRAGFDLPPAGETRLVPNEVILTVASSLPQETIEAIAQQNRLTHLGSRDLPLLGERMVRWRIDDGRSVSDVIRALQGETRIAAAQPNYVYRLQQQPTMSPASLTPTTPAADPIYYSFRKLRLAEAQALTHGENVLVAIIDSHIDDNHPDLAGAIVDRYNALTIKPVAHTHGTAMAGAIAAQGKVVRGVAPSVKILAIDAFAPAMSGAESTTDSIVVAISWAAQSNARVINMSFAGPSDPKIKKALAAARSKGIILIAAAGNAGPNSPPLYPAADPNVIAVTATDIEDKRYKDANVGSYITIAAPGVDLLALDTGGTYGQQTGTSIAAAQVSGIVALLLSRNPRLDQDTIRQVLTATARELGPKDQFGAGLADAFQAINALGLPSPQPTRAEGPPSQPVQQ